MGIDRRQVHCASHSVHVRRVRAAGRLRGRPKPARMPGAVANAGTPRSRAGSRASSRRRLLSPATVRQLHLGIIPALLLGCVSQQLRARNRQHMWRLMPFAPVGTSVLAGQQAEGPSCSAFLQAQLPRGCHSLFMEPGFTANQFPSQRWHSSGRCFAAPSALSAMQRQWSRHPPGLAAAG